MGLESATYVNDLTTSNPLTTDLRKQGDDHLRLIKTVLKATFPNASRAFYLTEYEAITSDPTVGAADMNRVFGASTSGGAFQVTLPVNLGTGAAGFFVTIIKLETNANAVTVAPTSGTINGVASLALYSLGSSITAVWTGTTWVAAVSTSLASAAQFRANSVDALLSTNNVWSAADPVALSWTSGGNTALDLSTGFNFTLTTATGNSTLAAPTNAKYQSGRIYITQDAVTPRTLAFASAWIFPGSSDPSLTPVAGAKDILFYDVINTTGPVVFGNLVKNVG